jgi:hypothetical protein
MNARAGDPSGLTGPGTPEDRRSSRALRQRCSDRAAPQPTSGSGMGRHLAVPGGHVVELRRNAFIVAGDCIAVTAQSRGPAGFCEYWYVRPHRNLGLCRIRPLCPSGASFLPGSSWPLSRFRGSRQHRCCSAPWAARASMSGLTRWARLRRTRLQRQRPRDTTTLAMFTLMRK